MNEPIYDFTFKEKYRTFSPGLYLGIFILGILGIPNIIAGITVTIIWAVNGFDSEYTSVIMIAFIFCFTLPLLFLIFAIRMFRKEINNRYVFYDNSFKIIVNGVENNVKYSDIVEIKEMKNIYHLYLDNVKCYMIGKSCLGEVTADEFEQFLIVHTNIRPKKMQ